MFMLNIGLDIKVAWLSLSLINKAFVLFFCAVSIYTISSTVRALLSVRSLKKRRERESTGSTHFHLLRKRIANLRQLHLFTLYLFGFCISIQVPDALRTLGNSNAFAIPTIMRHLTFLSYFDATIFLILMLLHSLQWLLSGCIHSLAIGKAE